MKEPMTQREEFVKAVEELERALLDDRTVDTQPNMPPRMVRRFAYNLTAARSRLLQLWDEREKEWRAESTALDEEEWEGLRWCIEDGAGRRYFNAQAYIVLRAKLRRLSNPDTPK